jgi:succinyl-CoA synthetase beta subunit
MRLLEYEAKAILANHGLPIPASRLVSPTNTPTLQFPVVLKSQVPIGGRGKAGGIKVVKTETDLPDTVRTLFGLDIRGYRPNTLLAEELLEIDKEYYLSLVINNSAAEIELVAHTNGGVEVEENDSQSFLRIPLHDGSQEATGEQLAEYYGLESQSFALQEIVKNLYRCFIENDATLIEINPLVLTKVQKLVAGDCKMELDTAASFRHADWDFEDKPGSSNFVTLNEEGNVATIANGAGLAMATVDAVVNAGLVPANFLDIGGGANKEGVLKAFHEIVKYPHVKAIVINIFAGITRCDEVARAIIAAKQDMSGLPPLYIRLTGTNSEEALDLLSAASITTLPSLDDCLTAAKKEMQS